MVTTSDLTEQADRAYISALCSSIDIAAIHSVTMRLQEAVDFAQSEAEGAVSFHTGYDEALDQMRSVYDRLEHHLVQAAHKILEIVPLLQVNLLLPLLYFQSFLNCCSFAPERVSGVRTAGGLSGSGAGGGCAPAAAHPASAHSFWWRSCSRHCISAARVSSQRFSGLSVLPAAISAPALPAGIPSSAPPTTTTDKRVLRVGQQRRASFTSVA